MQISPTGFFGTITQAALKSFQRENGLDISGVVDDATIQTLDQSGPCAIQPLTAIPILPVPTTINFVPTSTPISVPNSNPLPTPIPIPVPISTPISTPTLISTSTSTSTPTYTSGTINIVTRVGGTAVTSAGSCESNIIGPSGYNAGNCIRTLTNQTPGSYILQWYRGYPSSGADTTNSPTITPTQTLPDGGNITFYVDFALPPPIFSVSSPASGATSTWSRGGSYNIQWSNAGFIAPSVRLSLYRNGSYLDFIAGDTPNSGNYSWLVPTSLADGSNYSVRVFYLPYPNNWGDSGQFTISN